MYVRSAKTEDLPQLYELCCNFAGRKLPQDVFEGIFRAAGEDPQRRLVVAVENEQIVGYADMQVRLLLSGCTLAAVLNEFFVKEETRGMGVGSGMLISLSSQAKSVGCTELLADCSRVNLKSQEFLERHGFVRSRHRFEKTIK